MARYKEEEYFSDEAEDEEVKFGFSNSKNFYQVPKSKNKKNMSGHAKEKSFKPKESLF